MVKVRNKTKTFICKRDKRDEMFQALLNNGHKRTLASQIIIKNKPRTLTRWTKYLTFEQMELYLELYKDYNLELENITETNFEGI